MRNRIRVLLGFALLASITIPAAASAAPKPRRHSPEIQAQLKAPTFSDAGDFSGTLSGTIVINGTSYVLASNVRIYEIGRGFMPRGTSVSQRMVSVIGVERAGARIVNRIMVRPVPDILAMRANPNQDCQAADENQPR